MHRNVSGFPFVSKATYIEQTTNMKTTKAFRSPSMFWFLAVTFGMSVVYLCAWNYIPEKDESEGLTYVFLSVINFLGQGRSKLLFYAAVMAHVLEAVGACVLAWRMQCSRSVVALWTIQTLWLGYPSLRLLLAQKNKKT